MPSITSIRHHSHNCVAQAQMPWSQVKNSPVGELSLLQAELGTQGLSSSQVSTSEEPTR